MAVLHKLLRRTMIDPMALRSHPLILRLYGIYAVTVFAVVAPVVLLIVAVMPGLRRRRQVVSFSARTALWLCGISIDYVKHAPLPTDPCVVVANHASYLDGVLLCGLLPPRFAFVIKREVTGAPLVHMLLRRIGSHFVERHNRHTSARDTRSLLRASGGGKSLAIFPEGTFRAETGIGCFRVGAFAAAVAGRSSVVPVTIEGARQILPAGAWLPRPGKLRVSVYPAIRCEGSGRAEMQRLALVSRAVFLKNLAEPDLADASDTFSMAPEQAPPKSSTG